MKPAVYLLGRFTYPGFIEFRGFPCFFAICLAVCEEIRAWIQL
jgi:hypothetical protein